jgi:hypothetical protein
MFKFLVLLLAILIIIAATLRGTSDCIFFLFAAIATLTRSFSCFLLAVAI